MEKVIVFGGTGHLGKKILEVLLQRSCHVTAIVRDAAKAERIRHLATECRVVPVTDKQALAGCCEGYDVVISALGKSVSPADKSRPGFREIDLEANTAILEEALRAGVKKFVYVSALHAERYPNLEYFRVHHEFSERLKASGIDYAIIKPPALFSAFIDIVGMAQKGQLMQLGKGDKRTNPIYEGDLAAVCVDAIKQPNVTIEAGGPQVLSRRELNEIIQQQVKPGRRLRTMPAGLLKAMLPLIRIVSRNTYDKFAFFLAVLMEDTIAPQVGTMRFEDYIREVAQRNP